MINVKLCVESSGGGADYSVLVDDQIFKSLRLFLTGQSDKPISPISQTYQCHNEKIKVST